MFDTAFEARCDAWLAAQRPPALPLDERAAMLDELGEQYENLLRMDDADDCVLGVCFRYGTEPHLAYDLNAVLLDLQQQGMTAAEAQEFWEFNMVGAYVGETTPCFIDVLAVRPVTVPIAPHGGLECQQ